MKKQRLHPLLLITAVFISFLCGFAAGRNYNNSDVQVSPIQMEALRSAQPSVPVTNTAEISIFETIATVESNIESSSAISASISPTQPLVSVTMISEPLPGTDQPDATSAETAMATEAPKDTESAVVSTESIVSEPTENIPSPQSTGLININTASAAQLETLPGIGEVIAQRIVDYRNTYGPFQSVGALINVKGIGEKRLAAIINLVTI